MLNFGIIGCGQIAHRHAKQMEKHGKIKIVCDIIPQRADNLSRMYKAKPTYHPDLFFDSLSEVDLVAVCTPNGLHAEHSIRAMQSGCHVLCEKPMSIDVASGKKMIETSHAAGKKLFVVKQNRYNPPVVAVKDLLGEKKLGKIYSIQVNCFWNRNRNYYQNSWHGNMQLDGGTLFTQFSHFVDLLYWFFGDVTLAKGFSFNYKHQGMIDFEDTGIVALKFENNIIGTIHYTVNSYQRNMEGSLTIFAEKGTVKIGGQYLNELEYQNIDNHEIKNIEQSQRPNQYGHYQGSMSNHDKVYQNIIQALNGQEKIAVNGEEGLKTIEIIEKIYAAIR